MSLYLGHMENTDALFHITSGSSDSLTYLKKGISISNTVLNSNDENAIVKNSIIVHGIKKSYVDGQYSFEVATYKIPSGYSSSLPFFTKTPTDESVVDMMSYTKIFPGRNVTNDFGITRYWNPTSYIRIFDGYIEFRISTPTVIIDLQPRFNENNYMHFMVIENAIKEKENSILINNLSVSINGVDFKKNIFLSISSSPNIYDRKAPLLSGSSNYVQFLNQYSIDNNAGGLFFKNDGLHAYLTNGGTASYPVFTKDTFSRSSVFIPTFTYINESSVKIKAKANEQFSFIIANITYALGGTNEFIVSMLAYSPLSDGGQSIGFNYPYGSNVGIDNGDIYLSHNGRGTLSGFKVVKAIAIN